MYVEIQNFTRWLRCKHPHTSTPIHYGNDLKLFFARVSKSPNEITIRDVDDYISHCRTQGQARATINRRLAALRSFYHFLAAYSESPPANPIIPRRHFIKQGCRLPRDVDDKTLEQLFAIINSAHDRAIFTLMLRCGLRVGEVYRLSVKDVELHPAQPPHLRIWGKGGKQRIVYLSSQALTTLNEWLAVRPNSSDPALFLNRFGRRLSSAGIQSRLVVYCRQAGVQLTCHQLRHTFGRHLTEAQVPVTTTQRLLGHSQLKTTQLYTHLSNQQAQTEFETAMEQISGWLSQTSEVSEDCLLPTCASKRNHFAMKEASPKPPRSYAWVGGPL